MSNRKRLLDEIPKVLAKHPHGASIHQILGDLGLDKKSSRTVQRQLKLLIRNNQVQRTGNTAQVRYHLVLTVFTQSLPADGLKLSEAGTDILTQISAPLNQRKKIGYQPAFLRDYIPNSTYYLTKQQREYLTTTGKTTFPDYPAGTYAKHVLQRLLVDLSWNSSRLEGNTYSLLDTKALIDDGTPAQEMSPQDTQMILNHKDAIEFLVGGDNDEIGTNYYTITNLHALLSNNLLSDPSASGRLRRHAVGIGDSVYTPLDNEPQIERNFRLLLKKGSTINDPMEQAFFVMVHLPYLQAFDDVNKRVSRLAANIPLNKHNLSPLTFTDVPKDQYIAGLLGIYELNKVDLFRDIFIWAYERSAAQYAAVRQTLGAPDSFRIKYRDQIRSIIHTIISEALNKIDASIRVKDAATALPSADQAKFIETVDSELLSLHQGNFARYLVTPSQFNKWQNRWK